MKEIASQKFTTLVVQERSEPKPRTSHVHLRGDFLTKGKEVTAGIPAVFPALPADQPTNRLALAKWLIDPANPYPRRFTGHLRVTLDDGTVHEHRQDHFKGGAGHPLSDAALRHKFDANCRHGGLTLHEASHWAGSIGHLFDAAPVRFGAPA